MRLELTRVGLLVEIANYYTTRGAMSQITRVDWPKVRVTMLRF